MDGNGGLPLCVTEAGDSRETVNIVKGLCFHTDVLAKQYEVKKN